MGKHSAPEEETPPVPTGTVVEKDEEGRVERMEGDL